MIREKANAYICTYAMEITIIRRDAGEESERRHAAFRMLHRVFIILDNLNPANKNQVSRQLMRIATYLLDAISLSLSLSLYNICSAALDVISSRESRDAVRLERAVQRDSRCARVSRGGDEARD